MGSHVDGPRSVLQRPHRSPTPCTCQNPGRQPPCPSRGRRQRAGDLLSAAQLSGTAQLDARAHGLSSVFTSEPSTPLLHPVRFPAPISAPSPPRRARFPSTKVFFLALMDVLARQPHHTGDGTQPTGSEGQSFSLCRQAVETGRVPAHCSWRCEP